MILTVLLILCICAGISSVFGGSPSKKAQLAARGGGNQSLLDSNGNSNKSVHGPLTQPSNNHHNNQTASSSSSITVALSINAENQLILAFKVLASRDFFPKQMFPKFMRAHREHTTTTAAGHALKEVYVDSSDGEDQSLSLLRVVRGALVRYLDDYHPGDFTPSFPCFNHHHSAPQATITPFTIPLSTIPSSLYLSFPLSSLYYCAYNDYHHQKFVEELQLPVSKYSMQPFSPLINPPKNTRIVSKLSIDC